MGPWEEPKKDEWEQEQVLEDDSSGGIENAAGVLEDDPLREADPVKLAEQKLVVPIEEDYE
jgi:hypothetical protein